MKESCVKKVGCVLVGIVVILVLFGCSKSRQTSGTSGEKNYVVAMLTKQDADTFTRDITNAVVDRAKEVGGVTVIVQDAEGDISKQLAQAEAMITQRVDAIIINSVDVEGCAPIVDMAAEAGIPLIQCNTVTTNTERATCYVGSDDVDAGRIQANFLKDKLKNDAKVVYMMGPMGVAGQILRKQGIEEALFNITNIQVLAEQTANWKRTEALTLAENWLTSYRDLDAIICQNDDMALGALEAAEAAGRQDDLIIIGIDAIPDALQAVKEGRLNCTVFQDAKGQGGGSLDAALRAIKGGYKKMDNVIIPFVLVTKENVNQFM
jgi:ABC-type sugar transport system substrate-binding protein